MALCEHRGQHFRVADWSVVSGAGNNPAMMLRWLRDGDVLEDGHVVLVRGGDLDPDILCADAARYHSVYGVYGISVFAARACSGLTVAQVLSTDRPTQDAAEV
jgi:hypothetical protein